MMNNRIDLAESSEEEEDFGLSKAEINKAVQDLEQANIQACSNAKAETEVNVAQVSSPSSASAAPASASAPASAASILLDSAPSISGDAASSVTLLQDYESSGQPLVLPSVALNTPMAQYGVENIYNAAEIDASITQETSPSSTFGPEALGVSSSNIDNLYYRIQFLRGMADEVEWQMQLTFGPEALGVSSSNMAKLYYRIQCLRDMADEMECQMQLLCQMDTQYSYINEEQLPGDGGAGLGESNVSTAISLEEGETNDLAHGDVNTEREAIPRSENPLENKRLRKEFFGALSAKTQVNYQ